MTICRACQSVQTIKLKRDLYSINLCLSCASISTEKLNNSDVEYNEAYYQTYYLTRDDESYKGAQVLIRNCEINIKEKILDFGAGSGVLGRALMDEGYDQVYMYDKSIYAQEFMKNSFSNSDKIIETTKDSIHVFKTIFMTDVISHLDDIDGVITHLSYDLTTSDACFIIRTPIFSAIQNYFLFFLSWFTKGKFDDIILFTRTRYCLFTLKGLKKLVYRHNLSSIQLQKKNTPPYNPGKSILKKVIFAVYHFLISILTRYNQIIMMAHKKSGL